MYSAASILIRRRCVLQFLEPLRCFSTETLTLTLTGGYDSSIKEERIPKQVVFSRDQEGILFSIDPTHLPLPSAASRPLKEGMTVLSPEFIEDGKGPNFVVHDSFLVLRRRSRSRSRHCFYPWRSFSTQTQGQTQTLARDDADSSKERARRSRVPMLMVFSRNESPQSCSLFSLSRSIENGKDRNFLKFEQEITLPETAAADKSICIGSSEGILFTIPKEIPTEVSAVDPLTGAHLPLPSTSTLQTDDPSLHPSRGKLILSPSRDMVVLSHLSHVHIASLRDGDRYWTQLPNDFVYNHDLTFNFEFVHDVIFHKGLLYALEYRGFLGRFDLNNSSMLNDVLGYVGHRSHRCFLVESPDGKDLFLLDRQTWFFDVFKLNRRGKWKRVRSIGDMAIFIGINQTVSLAASHFPDILKPNSIYFTDSHEATCTESPTFAGVLSLESGRIQFFELTNGQHVLDWPNWPPPVWFNTAATSQNYTPLKVYPSTYITFLIFIHSLFCSMNLQCLSILVTISKIDLHNVATSMCKCQKIMIKLDFNTLYN